MLIASFSRYVVDLNRPADDTALYGGRLSTGLCPQQTFDGRNIYSCDKPIDAAARVTTYWRPYHDKIAATLEALKKRFGLALLWDAHSIASEVPALFDGELAELNIGTWDGRSCVALRREAVVEIARASGFTTVVDGRFKGGYITRHYGNPGGGIDAMQLEIAQRAYMDEASREYDEGRASPLRDTLRAMLSAFTMPA